LKATSRTQRLLLVESATLLGIVSTLLTWLVGRGPPCFSPPYFDMIVCLPGARRGFPLVWVTEVDWPGRCAGGFVCPPIMELTVDWFGLAVDLLFWTLLFVLLLGLWWGWHHRRTCRENSEACDQEYDETSTMPDGDQAHALLGPRTNLISRASHIRQGRGES
jgi:hypothetical protein